jgi:hypothetical protein
MISRLNGRFNRGTRADCVPVLFAWQYRQQGY